MPFSNPGFEYALSDGWSTLGSVSREGVDSTFAASSGSYYARLTSSGASRSDIETFMEHHSTANIRLALPYARLFRLLLDRPFHLIGSSLTTREIAVTTMMLHL
jgi:hypothetical protein